MDEARSLEVKEQEQRQIIQMSPLNEVTHDHVCKTAVVFNKKIIWSIPVETSAHMADARHSLRHIDKESQNFLYCIKSWQKK